MNKIHVYELNNELKNNNKIKIFYPNILVKTKSLIVMNQINWNSKRKWDNSLNFSKKNRDKNYKNNKSKISKLQYKNLDNKTINSHGNNNIINKRLINAKNQIDLFYNKREWDCVKKITNPFELIYITNRYNKKNSISLYDPLSRSYFKMIEMIHEFLGDIHPSIQKTNMKTLHLAEGPGGFMEAFINYRKTQNDIYYGMTLKSVNNNIPGWYKSNYFINKHTNLNIITGVDNMGDLYNIYNHYYVMNRLGRNEMDIITGDGGFDFSVDFNLQEQYAQKLIYAQILMGLEMLKKGGTFICKFFDTFTNLTQELIFLLYLFYDKVYIYKPFTSRLANSERYIICKGYKGISTLYLYELIQILDIWNDFDAKNKLNKEIEKHDRYNFKRNGEYKNINIESIINIDNLHTNIKLQFTDFKKQINKINMDFQNIQINNINKTIDIIKYPPNTKWYKETCKEQVKIAIQWCKKYNVPHKSFIYNLNYKTLYDFN